MAQDQVLEWERFRAAIAEVADAPPDAVTLKSRLIEDLGVDSFGLAELVAVLLVDLAMSSLESDLVDREWERLTVGELFEEYLGQERPAGGPEFVMRRRRSV